YCCQNRELAVIFDASRAGTTSGASTWRSAQSRTIGTRTCRPARSVAAALQSHFRRTRLSPPAAAAGRSRAAAPSQSDAPIALTLITRPTDERANAIKQAL